MVQVTSVSGVELSKVRARVSSRSTATYRQPGDLRMVQGRHIRVESQQGPVRKQQASVFQDRTREEGHRERIMPRPQERFKATRIRGGAQPRVSTETTDLSMPRTG